ncbi:MAG: sigma-70 family RNA polymerase sigma factor [Planctomycetes bacterium]|nr:sigma-70 family RNA polymerase sigma factor [Planctomycetota bacterium]
MTANPRPGAALDAETLLAHGAWLAAVARALVARDDDVDDVVQQTYARALERPPAHHGNVKGWLGTVARNVWRSRSRADRSRVAREAAVAPPTPVETPHEAVERAELRRLVVESVLALNEPYRSTVILRFFEEREMADIARLTSAGEETVRTRLRRGLQRVRQMLERSTSEGTGDAVREGVAARALLFARLRDIAASGGGGGAPGSAATSLALARAGRSVNALPARAIVVSAAAIAVVTIGSLAWWRAESRDQAGTGSERASEVATVDADQRQPPLPSILPQRERPEIDVVEGPPSRPPGTGAAVPAPAGRATIRGVVTDFDGNPLANALVWAIASPAHELPFRLPEFAPLALAQARSDPAQPRPHSWIEQRTSEDGSYEFAGLSVVPGWVVGAFFDNIGATVSRLVEFDRSRLESTVDLRLERGIKVRGILKDEAGTPIGGGQVALYMDGAGSHWSFHELTKIVGPARGSFEFPLQCGDAFQVAAEAPTYQTTPISRLPTPKGATGAEFPLVLRRLPGVVVRGAIVDPAGDPLELLALLDERFPFDEEGERWMRASFWAIQSGATLPPQQRAGMTAPGVVEGLIDFEKSTYEVVVPARFRGNLELRIDLTTVGSEALDDPTRPPVVEADEARLPEADRLTGFAVQIVEAATKAAIDLRHLGSRPRLIPDALAIEQATGPSDLEHGVVGFRSRVGPARVEVNLPGFAPSRFRVVVPRDEAARPTVLEVPRTAASVRGHAAGSDGRPLARAELFVHRRTPDGWVEAMTQRVVTNLDGEFEFPSLAAGEHAVVVSPPLGEAAGVARFDSGLTSEVAVRSRIGRPIEFAIRRDSGDRGVLPFAVISLLDRDGLLLSRYSNRDLTATAEPQVGLLTVILEDGPHVVVVSSAGFLEAKVEFDAPCPRVAIALEPAETR